jgi:hypothetical protein
VHRHIALARTSAAAALGHRAQSLHTNVDGVQLIGIAHHTMDDQTRPAIARGQIGHHVAKQGAGHRATTVNHQHLALARLAHGVAHQGNVFVDAQGANGAGEGRRKPKD